MPKVIYTPGKGLVQSTGGGFVMGTEALTTAGACDATVPVTLITAATNGIAMTLADGSTEGQLKYFISLHATNNATVTPATTCGAYANFVLSTLGDTVALIWTASGWAVFGRNAGIAQSSATAVAGLPIFG